MQTACCENGLETNLLIPFSDSSPFALCRDGEPIEIEEEDDEKHVFSDDSSELTIRNVDKNDEAEYVCIAENKAGEQDASIHLKVFGRYSSVLIRVTVQPQFLLLCTLCQKCMPTLLWHAPKRQPFAACSDTQSLVQETIQ